MSLTPKLPIWIYVWSGILSIPVLIGVWHTIAGTQVSAAALAVVFGALFLVIVLPLFTHSSADAKVTMMIIGLLANMLIIVWYCVGLGVLLEFLA